MSAEVLAVQPNIHEQHAASLSTIHRLGRLGLAGEAVQGVEVLAYADFVARVAEMIKTDEEFGKHLDITRPAYFAYSNGHTRAADGTPMVDVVQKGYDAAQNSDDVRLKTTQAERDKGDVWVAEQVDTLNIGEAILVVSFEPKKELAGSDRKFWHDRGYRDGVAYEQVYCRVSESEVMAVTLSVDHSDISKWREVFSEKDVVIAHDVGPNQFIRHAYCFQADAEMALETALAIREAFYKKRGVSHERLSVDAYMAEEQQQTFLRTTFDAYYLAIGRALVTKTNQPVLQKFAQDVLRSIPVHKLSVEARRQLMRITNSSKFDDDMGRVLDQVIPYAAKEHLRRGLEQAIYDFSLANVTVKFEKSTQNIANSTRLIYRNEAAAAHAQAQSVQGMILSGLSRGVQAGRGGGGCSGVTLVLQNIEGDLVDILNPQSIFGGIGEKNSLSSVQNMKLEGDEHGPYKFRCHKCNYENDRRKAPNNWVEKCQGGCNTDLSCGKSSTPEKSLWSVSLKPKHFSLRDLFSVKEPSIQKKVA